MVLQAIPSVGHMGAVNRLELTGHQQTHKPWLARQYSGQYSGYAACPCNGPSAHGGLGGRVSSKSLGALMVPTLCWDPRFSLGGRMGTLMVFTLCGCPHFSLDSGVGALMGYGCTAACNTGNALRKWGAYMHSGHAFNRLKTNRVPSLKMVMTFGGAY